MERRPVMTNLFMGIFLFFAVAVISFGASVYFSTARIMKEQLGSKCVGIATAVSALIEQDIDSYRSFIETLDTQSEYYKTMKSRLEQIRYSNYKSIAFLYTEVRISDTEMMYVFDAEMDYDIHFSEPGLIDTMNEFEIKAYETKAPFMSDTFVENSYGSLLTCYAPIFDRSTNEFIGLVGVDVSIDQYYAVMRNQMVIIIGSISMLVFTIALVLILSSGRVEKLLIQDSLTGVYNKAYFLKSLRHAIRFTKRKEASLIVFMADLDHFKHVNDRYGHPFGDVVLETVAKTMAHALRKTDCLARYGGEEFAAYLPDTDVASSRFVVERIRMAVESTRIYNEEFDEEVGLTISIGVVQAAPGQSAADVIEQADKALYSAKRTRNTVAYYADGDDE